jgi:GTPase SAR1 family protein
VIGHLSIPKAAHAITVAGHSRYTNAKVVLLGESGVGKSGLALRLAEDRWEETGSTHGMKVWQLDLGTSIAHPEVEREVWLWDLAGQPDYRLIHQLFLDQTAVALVLFDSQKPDDPFYGLGEWEKALRTAIGHDPTRLLVAARADRTGAPLTEAKIRRFCDERGYVEYLETSAKGDLGCKELRDALAMLIPWEGLEEISTPQLFKDLKEAVIEIKAESGATEENRPLIRFSELAQRLHMMKPKQQFDEAELRTVVRLLAGQGLVRSLGFGDFILLQPEQINNYAAAVVRAARAHSDGIGCIVEDAVLKGAIEFHDMPRLTLTDEEVLLRAMLETFVDQSLCIREQTNDGVLLVFPSQYNREMAIREHPSILVTYRFSGHLETIYATLVVRLVYSGAFTKHDLWKNAAEFTTAGGHVYGFVMNRPQSGEGIGEIKVFFEKEISDDQRILFLRFIHEHLKKKAADVEREREYVCPACEAQVARARIKRRQAASQTDVACDDCNHLIPLKDLVEKQFEEDGFLRRVQELDRTAGIRLDNESLRIRLTGHAAAIAYEAGQIYHGRVWPELGIDGKIEFKDDAGRPSGRRVGLYFATDDLFNFWRQQIPAADQPLSESLVPIDVYEKWKCLDADVFMVLAADDTILWFNPRAPLHGNTDPENVKGFHPFTALSLVQVRDSYLA